MNPAKAISRVEHRRIKRAAVAAERRQIGRILDLMGHPGLSRSKTFELIRARCESGRDRSAKRE